MANVGLEISWTFRTMDNDQPIAVKMDGARFSTSNYTLKFRIDSAYKIKISVRPVQQFSSLEISGVDAQLHEVKENCGEYLAKWDTKGFTSNRPSTRQEIIFDIKGTGCYLQKSLQAKFYEKEDEHASGGEKVDSMKWRCKLDPDGRISVLDEVLK